MGDEQNSLALKRMSMMMIMTMIIYARCNKDCMTVTPSESGFPNSEMLVAYVRQTGITRSREAPGVHIVCNSDAQSVGFRQCRLGKI
jgi:hypothetical protein